ncbi:hypothetical protein [Paracoccus sediminis]|uniref:Uncharacterized protein n=1 Tax=Paracoccus sediminis TaxID=1214787 RepID=A0A238Y809_9RHOB|nr:hypothetical protein [Paracoccus sediminis]SNR67082.1 hypothetical protein SAMN06265378_11558 [Paracoccus sediminis]
MIVLALILILAGSLTGAVALWLHDASFWMVVLGYVGGGWAGLLLGLPMMLAVRLLARRPRTGPQSLLTRARSRRPRSWPVPQEARRTARNRVPTPPNR